MKKGEHNITETEGNKGSAKINIELDFWRLKIQFVELDIYSLFFQKSSTD